MARRARDAFEDAAGRSTPVLVVAEAGCRGFDVVRVLHDATRAGEPLVPIDCSAYEPSDLSARLFGAVIDAEEGGATDLERLGQGSALAVAAGGTLLLENIDDLPASAQRRLARVLRDGEVRIGAAPDAVALTCRVAALASHDLESEVQDRHFRQDLLRRFQACRILVPSLRQRPSDLGAIVERLVGEMGPGPRPFTQPAITVLAALPWARNLDELASVLARVLESAGDVVRQEDVLAHLPIDGAFGRQDLTASLREARRRFERDYIAAVLERHHWRMSEAARTLGIERANLYRKARQLGISRVPRVEAS